MEQASPSEFAAEQAFRRELEREAPIETAPSEPRRALLRCELVLRGLSARLRRRVLREVVAPCVGALLLALERGGQGSRAAPSTPRPSAC